MYQIYLIESQSSDLHDSTEIEADAYFSTMYYFISRWYVENVDHSCTSDRSPTPVMCYNSDWSLSDQTDTLLEGWEMCDGRRPTPIYECNTDVFLQIPLPDEARPTTAEEPSSGYRFNLNPNDNALVSSLSPMSLRFAANYHSIELFVDEEDVTIPNLLSTTPPSGSRSVRINNEHVQRHVNTIRRQFWVETGMPAYSFSYAFVMEDPDHGASINPFFRAIIRNQYCEVVDELCVIANVENENVEFVDVPGLEPVVYRRWSCHTFDLTPYIGQPVTIEFTAADCGQAGHFGYAYISDICEECGRYPEITLDTNQYFCLPFPMEFCGHLNLTEGYSLIDLVLEVSQQTDSLLTLELTSIDSLTGAFCFEIDETDIDMLADGGYDVYAVAYLTNPNGDTIELRSYSSFPNTLGSTDNDFFIGNHYPQIELDLFVDCQDSSIIYLIGDYNPFYLDSMILEEGHIVWDGENHNYSILELNPFSGHWVLSFSVDSLPENCPAPFTLVIPMSDQSPIVVCDSLCATDCVNSGDWAPEIPICTDTDTILICGPFTAPNNSMHHFVLTNVDISLIYEDGGEIVDITDFNVPFDTTGGLICLKLDISNIEAECFELKITLRYRSPNNDQYVEIYEDIIAGAMNDICLPLEPCCPEDLDVYVTTMEFMPVFGDVECDEYVYYISGSFHIPAGFEFCDSLPVFEGGYIVYDDIDYVYFPPIYNMVLFEGHVYITDYANYLLDSALYGIMYVCDTETGVPCPAEVKLRYVQPMNGMMCNFEHCIDEVCDPCEYDLFELVPVRSCMTLQFPHCGECGVGSYQITVKKPNGQVGLVDTIYWDSLSIGQEFCLTRDYGYIPTATYGCYTIELESDCGHYCETSICMDNLDPCTGYVRIPSNSPVEIHDEVIVYPNPNSGEILHVRADFVTSHVVEISVYNIEGAIILSRDVTMDGSHSTLSTSDFKSGTYFMSLRDKTTGLRKFARFTFVE